MRLLMIDDDAAMGDLVRRVAQPLGYEVETYTEATAFKLAQERSDADVIVLDLTMPGTDGIELLRHLSQRGTAARIFIMSGIHPTVRRMAMELGQSGDLQMAGIIPKPVRATELRTILAPVSAPTPGNG